MKARLVAPLCFLLLLHTLLAGFLIFDWGHGSLRGGLLLALALSLLALGRVSAPASPPPWPRWLHRGILVLCLLGVVFNTALGVSEIVQSRARGGLRLDQGECLFRACQLLARGENPYACGQIVDAEAFRNRQPLRRRLGLPPGSESPEVLSDYLRSLDPSLRAKLLPVPPEVRPQVRLETALLGFKYGPVLILVTASWALWLGIAAVPLLQLVAYLAWLLGLWRLSQLALRDRLLANTCFCAITLDWHSSNNLLRLCTSDVWVLALASWSTYAYFTRQRVAQGVLLALALASKLWPAMFFLSLLLATRCARSLGAFALTSAVLWLPWVCWDAQGLLANLVLWPSFMAPDSTSWTFYSPRALVTCLRVALLAGAGRFAWRLALGQERRPFLALALGSLSLAGAGNVLHNNYLTWFSAWAFLAVAEAFGGAGWPQPDAKRGVGKIPADSDPPLAS